MKKIKVLSLFDGISIGKLALEELKIANEYYASEIKDIAIKVSKDNFDDIIRLGDVKKVRYENGILYSENGKFDVGRIDLLIGGSPCQNFSVAMKPKYRLGLQGDKSSLFYEYLRLLNEIKPKYFFLENVASMRKEERDNIDSMLNTKSIKINSKLVSGQLRNRLYWTNIEQKLDEIKDRNIKLQDLLEYGYTNREKSRCLTVSDSRPHATPVKMFHRYYGKGFTTLIFKDEKHYNDCKNHYDNNFKGFSAKDIDLKIKNENINLDVYNGVRYLNQLELERLQTVPNGYTKILNRNDSANVLGDGWTLEMIKCLFRGLEQN